MVVAATGFFDGVHLGHRRVIDRLCSQARIEGKKSMIVTFWPHPRNVLQQDADRFRLLTSLEEKRKLCISYGVDDFQIVPFSREFSMMDAERFISEYLVGRFNVSTLVLGYDHKLGHDVEKSQAEIMEILRGCGVTPVRVEELTRPEATVSSTSIRRFLYGGDVASANRMLGYRYSLHGVVVSGNKMGRTLGFPTANLQLYEPLKLVPANGVYAVWVEVFGKVYRGICNIGTRPTMTNDNVLTIETHILDFNQDIYGLDIKLEFCSRMRDEVRFASVSELVAQLSRDKAAAFSLLPDIDEVVMR